MCLQFAALDTKHFTMTTEWTIRPNQYVKLHESRAAELAAWFTSYAAWARSKTR